MSYKCHSCNKKLVVAYNATMNRFACKFCGEVISGKQLVTDAIISDCIVVNRIFECEKYSIFKAYQRGLQRNVLLKILNLDYINDKYSRQIFFDEAKNMAKIDFPNFIQVYQSGVSNEICYTILDFFDGEKLSNLMTRIGSLNTQLILNIAIKLCNALEYINQPVLNDNTIKPDNIWINSSNEIKIYDLNQSIPEEYEFSRYNAPEVNNRTKQLKFDHRQYIYTVGAIVYEMFSGGTVISEQQFREEKDLSQRQNSREPTSLKHLFNNFDDDISDFVDMMLKINIEERPVSWNVVKEFFEKKLATINLSIQNFEGTTSYRTYESLSIPSQKNHTKLIILIFVMVTMFSISLFSYNFILSYEEKTGFQESWDEVVTSIKYMNSIEAIMIVKKFIRNNNNKLTDTQREHAKFILESLFDAGNKEKILHIRSKNLMSLATSLTELISVEQLEKSSKTEVHSYLNALENLIFHIQFLLKYEEMHKFDFKIIKQLYENVKKRQLIAIKILNKKQKNETLAN